MTLILAVATLAVLSSMGVACYRAQAEAAERLCDSTTESTNPTRRPRRSIESATSVS